MSRTIKFAKAGGPEVLEFVEVQVPAPGPNEVRIKVKAIGINRAEAMWRVDDYIEPVKKFPAGLGYEAAGSVDAVGKNVSGFAVGDDVNVIPSFSLNDYATYGEVILVPDHAVEKTALVLLLVDHVEGIEQGCYSGVDAPHGDDEEHKVQGAMLCK